MIYIILYSKLYVVYKKSNIPLKHQEKNLWEVDKSFAQLENAIYLHSISRGRGKINTLT